MNRQKLQAALVHAGVKEGSFLGEGAWHYAWRVWKGDIEMVLRIPKEVTYGKPVLFDESALKAEYGGTELYYHSVNKAATGAAPELFKFHVSPSITYTLESFGGQQIDLHSMPLTTAYQTGKKVGEIHRKTEEIPHGLDGFGYLGWSEDKGLHGLIEGEATKFLEEESSEHLADYQELCRVYSSFKNETVIKALQVAVDTRKQSFTKPKLVNQDTSPENILMNGNQICLIDPYASIYYPRGMAGNFMNLYETLFIALSQTERYRKHNFFACAEQLTMMAKGFIEGYSAGSKQIVLEVRGEQLLQLLETTFIHHQLLSKELSDEMRIRYGSKKEIADRLLLLSKELNALSASIMKKQYLSAEKN